MSLEKIQLSEGLSDNYLKLSGDILKLKKYIKDSFSIIISLRLSKNSDLYIYTNNSIEASELSLHTTEIREYIDQKLENLSVQKLYVRPR